MIVLAPVLFDAALLVIVLLHCDLRHGTREAERSAS
jgi:hypothetical protein